MFVFVGVADAAEVDPFSGVELEVEGWLELWCGGGVAGSVECADAMAF